MGQQILSPQQQPSQSIIKQLSSRFDILPHPFYSAIPHMKLLVDRHTQTKYILRIITTNNESQHLRIEQLINKKLANKSKYITKLEQYFFQHQKSYCGNLSKCFLLFNLQRNITLRDLYSSSQSKNYTQEELIKGFNQLTNAVILMKNLNTPHGNISPLNVYAIDGQLTLSDPWIAPQSVDNSDKFPSPQKLLKINDRIENYDLFASDLFSIGMSILELARRQKLQRVYKKNYTLNTQCLIEEVEKVTFPKLKQLLKYILLSSQNNRIQYLNDYELSMKLKGQLLAEEHLKQRKGVRKIHLMSGRENYAKNNEGGIGAVNNKEIALNGFKKNVKIQTGTTLPSPQIQRLNPHIQPNIAPQHQQATHIYAVSQVQSRPFSSSANKPKINFVSENAFSQIHKNSSLQKGHPPPNTNPVHLPFSQFVNRYNDNLVLGNRNNQNIPISHIPSLPTYQHLQLHHTNIPSYNFSSNYTPLNRTDFSLKQHPKFPVTVDPSRNLTRLDQTKFNETSQAIKKLLEPINNRVQTNSKHFNYDRPESRKKYQLTPDNSKSNKPIHSNSSQSNQYAHVFDEKIKNFEMGVSNAIKNTILQIQKVSQKQQKESLKTIQSKIDEKSFGSSNIIQKQVARCKLISESQIKLPQCYEPIEKNSLVSQYLSDSLISDTKLICEQKVSQSRESQNINIACYGINGTIFQPAEDKNQEGDNVLNSFSNEQNNEQNRNTFIHGTQLESVSNLAIPQEPSSQEESFDSNLDNQDEGAQQRTDIFDNGSVYKGFIKNGQRNGEGAFYYKDGGCYEGHWKDNQMSGFGRLYYETGELAYQGQWFKDDFHGRGKLYNDRYEIMTSNFNYKDFNQDQQAYWKYYEGDFVKDLKEGHGKMILSNGQYYIGQFKLDRPHGRGRFYQSKNQVIVGIWNKGKLIKEGLNC